MTKTIITFPSGNTAIQLTPSEGYKYITNDNTFTDLLILGKNDSVDNWYDTNDEPIPPEPEQATEKDYINALERLGENFDN